MNQFGRILKREGARQPAAAGSAMQKNNQLTKIYGIMLSFVLH
jgi:hypothetical protein